MELRRFILNWFRNNRGDYHFRGLLDYDFVDKVYKRFQEYFIDEDDEAEARFILEANLNMYYDLKTFKILTNMIKELFYTYHEDEYLKYKEKRILPYFLDKIARKIENTEYVFDHLVYTVENEIELDEEKFDDVIINLINEALKTTYEEYCQEMIKRNKVEGNEEDEVVYNIIHQVWRNEYSDWYDDFASIGFIDDEIKTMTYNLTSKTASCETISTTDFPTELNSEWGYPLFYEEQFQVVVDLEIFHLSLV